VARRLVTLLLVASYGQRARALNPDWRLTQYGHTTWRIQDGALAGSVNAITQTSDGYLWIGTATGLIRFDGAHFTLWKPPAGETPPSLQIISLLGGSDGSLWIGTAAGLLRWKGEHLTVFRNTGRINAVVEDRQGGIWLAESRTSQRHSGPVCRVSGTSLDCYGKGEGIPFEEQGAEALVNDGQDGLWIGSVKGVCRWKPLAPTCYFPKELESAQGGVGVEALNLEPDGSLLVGLGGGGLRRLVAGVWSEYRAKGSVGDRQDVAAILRDHDGGVWIATSASGILRSLNGATESLGYKDGFSSDTVICLFEDREGNVWVGTTEGLDRFRDIPVGTISRREGLSQDHALSVLATSTGTIWIGASLYLDTVRLQPPIEFSSKYLDGKKSTSLLEDDKGRIWVGVGDGLNVLEDGGLREIRRPGGAPLGVVIALTEDRLHDVYAIVTGAPQKLFRIRDRRVVQSIDLPGGVTGAALASDPVDGVWIGFRDGTIRRFRAGRFEASPGNSLGAISSLNIGSDGSVFGASTKGLVLVKNGMTRIISEANGLPCNQTSSVILDDFGATWLTASCGIVSIAGEEINRWWAHPETQVRARLFGALDGAQTGVSPFGPVVSKAPDGKLWFANGTKVQFVDPRHLPENLLRPSIHIEKVVADRKTYPAQQGLRLPARTKNLQIDYTATSLSIPERVRFRYKLDGKDDDWQEPGTRREAFYDNLPPGPYRFHVLACNESGLWNDAGTTWNFSIAPAWFQTAWFRSSAVAGTLLTFWLLYRLRLRQIAMAMTARFEERVAERSRLAGELHDTVLQSVQAVKMIADNVRLEHGDDPARLREAIDRISEWLAQATTEARTALNALRTSTVQRNDLGEAFERTAETFGLNTQMSFVLSIDGEPKDLHPIVRDEIYRIGNEAIRNAHLHSKASRLEVNLSYRHDFILRVRDNGDGIDPNVATSGKPGHFGLPGMRERAERIHGTVRVMSRTGAGTEIELIVPGNAAFKTSGHRAGSRENHG
jgi:signal transduction histidine kinase/ligand-binding sensor domain-containing protein